MSNKVLRIICKIQAIPAGIFGGMILGALETIALAMLMASCFIWLYGVVFLED